MSKHNYYRLALELGLALVAAAAVLGMVCKERIATDLLWRKMTTSDDVYVRDEAARALAGTHKGQGLLAKALDSEEAWLRDAVLDGLSDEFARSSLISTRVVAHAICDEDEGVRQTALSCLDSYLFRVKYDIDFAMRAIQNTDDPARIGAAAGVLRALTCGLFSYPDSASPSEIKEHAVEWWGQNKHLVEPPL